MRTINATAGQVISLARRQAQVMKQVENGGLNIQVALDGTQGILDHKCLQTSDLSTPDWYTQPQQQIERVRYFLKLYGGRSFSKTPIPSVPSDFVPQTSTEVLMLAVYLPGNWWSRGMRRTFNACWDFIIPTTGYGKVWATPDEDDGSDPNIVRKDFRSLRLLPAIGDYRPGIRWVAFDPAANLDRSVASCWDDQKVAPTLASVEVLMAIALFPNWAASWKNDSVMEPLIAGLQSRYNNWNSCPRLTNWSGSPTLDAINVNEKGGYSTKPTVREL